MESYLPESIVWRKDKQGFTIPQAEWLKHELRQRMENLMDGEMLSAKLGLVDRQALQRRYLLYCNQPPNHGSMSFKDVFNPIALEMWLRRFESSLCLN